jgi:nitrogen regulatory protein PII
MNDTIEMPESPLPLTLGMAGDSVDFDTIICSHPPSNQFQLTYSSSTDGYGWNVRVFVREPFVGRGTYNTTVQVQLLENFSGGRYFAASSADVAVEVVVEDFGVNGAYGTITTDALTGDAGDVTIEPQPIPFWCAAIDD